MLIRSIPFPRHANRFSLNQVTLARQEREGGSGWKESKQNRRGRGWDIRLNNKRTRPWEEEEVSLGACRIIVCKVVVQCTDDPPFQVALAFCLVTPGELHTRPPLDCDHPDVPRHASVYQERYTP